MGAASPPNNSRGAIREYYLTENIHHFRGTSRVQDNRDQQHSAEASDEIEEPNAGSNPGKAPKAITRRPG